MGSSPEMESFGVSDSDYNYMLDPLNRRRKQSRKSMIYGVFASDDSDNEEEQTGFGGRSKRKGAKYSAPISFVSAGIKGGSPNDQTVDDPITDEDDVKISSEMPRPNSDSSDDEKVIKQRRKLPFLNVGSGRRAAAASKSSASGFGAWEKHTKGIGMKLLEQMGYQPGKGLGSIGQGITTPVQATHRVGKAAVGYFGSEAVPAPRKGNEKPTEIKTETNDLNEGHHPRYKKDKKESFKTKSKSVIDLTADEIVASLAPATPAASRLHGLFLENSEMSKVKVIDMTSKQQRVYTGYEAALSSSSSQRQDVTGSNAESSSKEGPATFDCPALRHNLSMMMRQEEDAIRKLDRVARLEEDRVVGLEHEIDRLTKLVATETTQTDLLKRTLTIIDEFESEMAHINQSQSHTPTKPDISDWIARIRHECGNLPELPLLLASVARPMLDTSLARWKPLSDPAYCLDLLVQWRDSLANTSAFDVVLETSWLATLRRAIVNDWDPHDCDSLLAVLEAWHELLPESLLQSRILDQLVLTKLESGVDRWDPLTDTVPIHTWLHPWLPWFGGPERLATVHEVVLQKLAICLKDWHPSDGSAHAVLLPWRSVFPVESMSVFMQQHIVPKLSLTLQQFQLNPSAQNMDAWKWVMRWVDLVGPAIMVNLLEHHFWPRWLSVLSNWLQQGVQARQRGQSTPEAQVFHEVGRWYAGWKGQIPPECMEYASVKDSLTRALAMMERAMRGLPPIEPAVAHPTSTVPSVVSSSTNYRPYNNLPTISVDHHHRSPTTLRQQIEALACQHSLPFHPLANRTVEGSGHQLYRFASLQLFFDRNVAFVLGEQGQWHPVSITDLMSRVLRH